MKYTHMTDMELIDKGHNQDANSLAYALATRLDSTLNDVYTLNDVLDEKNNEMSPIGPVTFTATVYLQSKVANNYIKTNYKLPLIGAITKEVVIDTIKKALQSAPENYKPLPAKKFFSKNLGISGDFTLPANLNYDERLATSINELDV